MTRRFTIADDEGLILDRQPMDDFFDFIDLDRFHLRDLYENRLEVAA